MLSMSSTKSFSAKNPKNLVSLSLSKNAWSSWGRLDARDNEELLKPFTETEVKKVIFSMKENSALGPDGFSVSFYKHCWELIKSELMLMINDFYMGNLDISRLNYVVITLIPKVKNANIVKQFRLICLLNVSFKIFTKLLTDKLTHLANKLISGVQTAFTKGRYILDGAVMLHEIVHDIKVKKKQGVLFKIDFKNVMTTSNESLLKKS